MEQRLYNLEEAQAFLGMTRSQWYKGRIEDYLTKIPSPGTTSRFLFDYYELNALADKMKSASGCPPKQEIGEWDNTNPKVSIKEAKSGGSRRGLKGETFENLAERLISTRQSDTSRSELQK